MTTEIKIYQNLLEISEKFDAFLLDAYGVFWGGNSFGLLPGAKETMERLVGSGKILGVLSNSTQLAKVEKEKLKKHGLIEGEHFHFLITSGEVSKQTFLHEKLPFKTPRKKYWMFGGIHPKYSSHTAIFQDSVYIETRELSEADFIYISIPHLDGEDQIDPELFREEVQKVSRSNLPMLCTNPDLFAHEGNPPKAVVRQGSIAAMYRQEGGEVFYIGKPHREVYEFSMEYFKKFNIDQPKKILMVGDTPETDIKGARHFGMASVLTVQTGIMAGRVSTDGFEKVVENFSLDERPDFYIKTL